MRKVSEMMQESRSNSYLFGVNAPYVEEMYEAYLDNPGSVPDNWRSARVFPPMCPNNDSSRAETPPGATVRAVIF